MERTADRTVLWLLAATQFSLILDAAIIGVALPAVASELSLTPGDLSWVMNAYVIPFGGFLLLGGRAADRLGRRRVFIVSAAAFAVASGVGAVAPNALVLAAARAGQGLAAAFLSPAALSLVLAIFEEGRARQRALGVWAGVSAAGGAAGFLLGGMLVELLGWRSVLYVNVPVGMAIAMVAPRILPADAPDRTTRSFDVAGAFAVTSGIGLVLFGLVRGGEAGFGDPGSLGALILGAVMLVAFVWIERHHDDPLLPPVVFRRPSFVRANVVAALITMAVSPMFFFLTLFAQDILGYTPLQAGLAQLPLSLIITLAATLAPRVIARLGVRATLASGLALLTIGLLLFARLPGDAAYIPDIIVAIAPAGVGAGLVWVAATIAATSGANAEDAGLYSGIVSTSQQLGSAVGLAALVTAAGWLGGTVTSGASADALRAGFALGAALTATALGLTISSQRETRAVASAAAAGAEA